MKKILISLCAGLLLLAGCSDANTSMSTSEELFKVGDSSVNTNDIYQALLPGTGTSAAVNIIQTNLLAELIPITDEIQTAADEFIEETKKNIGDTFEEQVKNAGYADVEEYRTKVAIPNSQNKELTKLYVNDKFEDLKTTYMPVKAEILQFASEAEANDAHEKIKAGTDIVSVGEELGTSSTFSGKEEVYIKGSDLPEEALKGLLNAEAGLNDVRSAANTQGAVSYYVINLISNDPSTFKDEAVDLIAADSEVSTEASSYYFREHNFKVYDKTIHDFIYSSPLKSLLEKPSKSKK